MTVTFDISLGDLIAFQAHYMGNDRKVRKMVKYTMIVFAAVVLLIPAIKIAVTGQVEAGEIMLVGIFGIILFIYRKMYLKSATRLAKKLYDQPGNASLMGMKTLTLGEDTIELSDRWKLSRWKWEGILKAGETDNHFFLYDSAVTAIVVPKAWLAAPDADRLRAIIKGHGLLH